MPDGSQPNAVANGSYEQFAFLPGLPSGWPSIRFQGIDDNTGLWYDPDTKSIKMRFAGTDVYVFDDTGGINIVAAGGPIKVPDGSAGAPSYSFVSNPITGFSLPSINNIDVDLQGASQYRFAIDYFNINNTKGIRWWSDATTYTTVLTTLVPAAAVLEQRNSTNAQTFRIYNTFTDASNYERAEFVWSSNVFKIQTTALGTGSQRELRLDAPGAGGFLGFYTGSSPRWSISSSGHFSPSTDISYDIGDSTHFSRDVYVQRNIGKIAVVTYSASMTPNAALGEYQQITVTNGTAFTVNAPINPLTGQIMRLLFKNTSGGAMGAVTMNAVFKMPAFVAPANGFNRTYEYLYDGTNWIEIDRCAADIPN